MAEAHAPTVAQEFFREVRGFLARGVAKIEARLEAIEKRVPERGEKGASGDPGADGKDGEKGLQGEPGAKGERGESGESGAKGQDGAQGRDGEKGLQGEKGDPGEKGNPGEPGPKGDRGEPGEKGSTGEAGARGQDGAQGKDGALGLKGADGLDGADGVNGRDGRDGQDGAQGRDAVHFEILPAIDEARAYPRGMYARHAGGLWRSFAATAGMKGWECIVVGLQAIEVEDAADGRSTIERHILSDGTVREFVRKSREMIYRGIWKEGAYQRGDTATRDGCLWHANQDTTGQPGASDDWQLCAKRGRDGKDGLRGEKGERGAEGRAGKDLTSMEFSGRKY